MKQILILAFLLARPQLASPDPAVTVRPETVKDSAVDAVDQAGKFKILAREALLDVRFPGGKKAEGRTMILFDPSSRLLLWKFVWSRANSRLSLAPSWLAGGSFVGVGGGKLVIINCGRLELFVTAARGKAIGLDDGQAQMLRWVEDHLAALELGSPDEVESSTGQASQESLWLPREKFPSGLFTSTGDEPRADGRRTPVKLVDIARSGSGWNLIFESEETGRRAILPLNETNVTDACDSIRRSSPPLSTISCSWSFGQPLDLKPEIR
jgi:hypothetical protein